MVSFKAAISALMVYQVSASYEKIANYEPGSQVTDHVSSRYVVVRYS